MIRSALSAGVDLTNSTVLAFDFGRRRIGVAVGNGLLKSGEPIATVSAANDADRFAQIQLLINEWRPNQLVVGRPVHPDGAPHEMTLACERFARQLEGRFGLPAALIDERFTSVAAQSELHDAQPPRRSKGTANRAPKGAAKSAARGRSELDALAAAIILRQYWSEQSNT